MADLVLGEKGTTTAFKSNSVLKLPVRGQTAFTPPPGGGQRLLVMYANVWLPKPLTEAREALARGGWVAWFQQFAPIEVEADRRDETGYLGPVAIPRFGDRSLLISHVWAHGVDADPWEFCVSVWAYDAAGKALSLPLTLGTRTVKILEL